MTKNNRLTAPLAKGLSEFFQEMEQITDDITKLRNYQIDEITEKIKLGQTITYVLGSNTIR